MKKFLLNFLWVLLFLGSQAYAQTRTVTGVVTGKDDGQPLAGVTVSVKGTRTGTQTGANGRFSLTVPSANSTLVFSFVGYAPQEVSASDNLNVSLVPSSKSLNDVIVVGYGTQQRKDVTGAVGSLKGSAVTDQPVASFDQALAGKVSGVQVTVSSGILGQAPRIRIRGTNSISSGADPLYVLDGVPILTGNQGANTSNNPLGDINPNDIQSIDVLKDGSATAIYGSRGSNGVIIITTKRGVVGKPRITYDAWFASAQPAKRFDLLDADQFIMIANEKLFAAATAANQASGAYRRAFPTPDGNGGFVNTDWQDVVFRNNAFQQNHALSISGATESSNYYFSAGFADLQGIVTDNTQRKYQVRGKLEQKALNNRVTFGLNSSVSYIENHGLNTSTSGLSGNVSTAIRDFPNVPAFNRDGSYNLSTLNSLGPGSNTQNIDDNYTNIQYILDHNVYSNKNVTINGDAFVNINILKGLDFRTQLGVNAQYGEDFLYWNPVHGDGGGSSKGYESQYFIPNFRYNWVNTLTYNKSFAQHTINLVAGTEIQKSRYRYFYGNGSQLLSEYFGGQNIISNTLTQSTFGLGGNVSENAYRSYFARANYSFQDKYLLSATFRADAISSLAPGNQYAYLPGGSIGWRISKEDFFKDSEGLKFINDLKIRGGYAKTGNTDIGNYPFAGIYGAAIYGVQNGLAFTQVGNNSLKFETTDKFDVGLDMSMLNNRVTLGADFFYNNDNNLVLAAPTAPSLGVPGNSINQNIGTMTNRGFELSVSSINVKKGSFTWTTDLNLTLVKNKITTLANNNTDVPYTYNVNRVGYSIGSLFGYQYAGVNPANGNPLYIKENGQLIQGNIPNQLYYNYDPANPTNMTAANQTTLGTSDKVILGNTNPTYFGGFNNTVSFKDFDLSVFMTFSGGNKVMNVTKQEVLSNQKFQNAGAVLLDRWTTTGQVTDVPRLYYGRDAFVNTTTNASSRFVEDGKFIRAQNIVLGYNLPKHLLSKISLTRVRLYAQVQNAFVITNYSGLDPELNQSVTTNSQAGIDFNTNPKPRTYLVGINVGF